MRLTAPRRQQSRLGDRSPGAIDGSNSLISIKSLCPVLSTNLFRIGGPTETGWFATSFAPIEVAASGHSSDKCGLWFTAVVLVSAPIDPDENVLIPANAEPQGKQPSLGVPDDTAVDRVVGTLVGTDKPAVTG